MAVGSSFGNVDRCSNHAWLRLTFCQYFPPVIDNARRAVHVFEANGSPAVTHGYGYTAGTGIKLRVLPRNTAPPIRIENNIRPSNRQRPRHLHEHEAAVFLV